MAQHLESIRLNPNDPKSPKLIPDDPNSVLPREWDEISKKIQEEVAVFFA